MTEVRVGVDLVRVADVGDSVAQFGPRYLHRIYTDHELGCCQGPLSVLTQGLAARFAAKEAAVKVLRPHLFQSRPDWRSIEVHRHADGWCELRLTGQAARLAEDARVESIAVSLSHERDLAGAVVVAICA